MSKTIYSITPLPGYILCEPYIHDKAIFKSTRETDGIDQCSIVIKAGSSITDSAGILRETDVKEGDIIVHAQTNKEFVFDFDKYRFVHFSEIHGILTITDTK